MELNTALIIILTFVVLFKEYIFSFFRKKGENLATRQDTGVITEIEERIKNTFRQELAKLQLQYQHEFSIATEKRNAIFNFTDSLYKLFYISFIIPFDLNYYGANGNKLFGDNVSKATMKYKTSLERLRLFFSNEEFNKVERRIYQNVHKLQEIGLSYLNEMDQLYSPSERLKNTANEVEKMQAIVNADLDKLRAILGSLIEEVFKTKSQ